jgi:hypothetical protein
VRDHLRAEAHAQDVLSLPDRRVDTGPFTSMDIGAPTLP